MSIIECLTTSIRRVVCCGLLFALPSYCYAGQVTINAASDELMIIDGRFDKKHIDRGNVDSLKRPRQLPQSEVGKGYEAEKVDLVTLSRKASRYQFALKTNLLYDAALIPNVELEFPIGKRWSVNGEYMFPWWLLKNDRYCLQIISGGLEGRYWLKNPKNRDWQEVLTGHFLGLYVGGGEYDLQWKDKGYQGEFYIAAGISYGWATRIARHLNLEFNLGIGLLRTDYRHYYAQDNYQTLLWKENGNYTWFGPTKAKISLVWLLGFKPKKGGRK